MGRLEAPHVTPEDRRLADFILEEELAGTSAAARPTRCQLKPLRAEWVFDTYRREPAADS
jgi:hypothetical protein